MRNLNFFHDPRPLLLGMSRALGLGAVALSPLAYAVEPTRAVSQYVRDRWGPEQGFPRGAVYAITQTADG